MSSATFISIDNTSSPRGDWIGTRGQDGYMMVGENSDYVTSQPSYINLITGASLLYTWNSNTAEYRGLQKPWAPHQRIASTFYDDNSFYHSFQTIGTPSYQLWLYLLDWDPAFRSVRVDVTEYNNFTNVYATYSSLSPSFEQGLWIRFDCVGSVSVFCQRLDGQNAVISGYFFDSNFAPSSVRSFVGGLSKVGQLPRSYV